jgi:cysteine desulfurase
VGALYVRRGTPLVSPVTGGHHEHNLRAGTENVAGIVGLAEALGRAVESLAEEAARLGALRDRLERGTQTIEAMAEIVPRLRAISTFA